VRAVTRLIDKGYEAYLVGGCVRDLLLDRTPKDYDIATEARPQQVKRTFPRNCRIIGRRFKLAHLHFHRNTKILECSTFRRNPQDSEAGDDEDLLITRDNEFGNAEEDALRRDFTINALFLDPTEDKIVDHVNGLADIEARMIRTIGEPVVRFREDPVRILRAVKFAGRLGFEIERETFAAMAETAEDLVRAAPPRILEEILRLLRSGHARRSFELLHEIDAIRHLVPVVGRFLEDADEERLDSFWALLGALDDLLTARPSDAAPPANGVLLGALLYDAVAAERARKPGRSASTVAEDLLGSLAVDLRLPRRDIGCLKRACGVQHRFEQDETQRRFRVESFVRGPYFEEALLLFELRTRAAEGDLDAVEAWQEQAAATGAPARAGDAEDDVAPRKKRRRRRRRRSDDEDRDAAAAEAEAEAEQPHAEADPAAAAEPQEDAEPAPRKRRRRRSRGAAAARPAEQDDEDLSDVTFPGDASAADDVSQDDGAEDPAPAEAADDRRAEDESSPRDDDDRDDDGYDHDHDHDGEEEREELTLSNVTLEDVTFDDDEQDEDEEKPRKRRRRRGRRGRGKARAEGEDHQERAETGDDEAPRAQRDGAGSKRGRAKSKKSDEARAARREGKRGEGRRKRGKGSRGSVRSDVGVVPRSRDRRGKVEVIEPIAQDLSAFDVELDPKRVPTFGSIVEGKGRPKRRGPRITERGDDYKPPPPPGADAPPGAAPPPPRQEDDTFGDW